MKPVAQLRRRYSGRVEISTYLRPQDAERLRLYVEAKDMRKADLLRTLLIDFLHANAEFIDELELDQLERRVSPSLVLTPKKGRK